MPEVQIYVAPDIEAALRSTGLDEEAVKTAVHDGLMQRRIYCTAENAVEDSDDWVAVQLLKADGRVPQAVMEMSVLNGPSANYQRIRWTGRKMVFLRASTTAADVLRVVDSVMAELGSEYGTPAYCKGKMRSE